jgi:Fe-S-cluster-containing dehydrogenase component
MGAIMKERYFVIDVAQCENCNNCFLACKDEHVGNVWPGYAASQPNSGPSWMRIETKERGQYPVIDVAYLPVPCMHCADPPCAKAAEGGAIYKRPDGIVIIDPLKAKGQMQLVHACPYHAIVWNGEEQIPQKCTLCAHLLDKGWEKTRCIQSCPTGALTMHFLEPADMEALIAAQGLEVLSPERKTGPRVYYRHLYRYTHCFIGGSVATRIDGREECVEGAEVGLLNDTQGQVAVQTTDAFGDFRFDGLVADSGGYRLRIVYKGRELAVVPIELKESVNAGVISI